MKTNHAMQRMQNGEPAIGKVASHGSPLMCENESRRGIDYILIDNQHGAWEYDSTMYAIRCTFLGGPATPMVRVRKNDFYEIGRVLDMGALGIVVPMVDNPEQAREAVSATYYPPLGRRSMGAFGARFLGDDYLEVANKHIFLAVQIESKEGYENAEDILSVEGVDGCWIGPSDLSASLGLDLNTSEGRETRDETIMQILKACQRAGKIPGIAGKTDRWSPEGFLFVL